MHVASRRREQIERSDSAQIRRRSTEEAEHLDRDVSTYRRPYYSSLCKQLNTRRDFHSTFHHARVSDLLEAH